MNTEIIQKLQYCYAGQQVAHQLPLPLHDSLQLISEFFKHNKTNKLCLVFPSKEYAAQWLSIPTVLSLIKSDFIQFKNEISESYKQYTLGEKLMFNNEAIVEWSGVKPNGVTFKTKAVKESSGAEITVKFSDVIKLQQAPPGRKVLSSAKKVTQSIPSRTITAIEHLLKIDTYGNKAFIKNNICLVSKLKSYNDSISNVLMNHASISDYFKQEKIDDNGKVSESSPMLISNNFLNLRYFLKQYNPVSKIIIDGFSTINEGITDFSEIDSEFNIPTILITDLSEIEIFETIGNFGFEFFNFTKEHIVIKEPVKSSPFHSFKNKLSKYVSFKPKIEICNDKELEIIAQKLHSLPKDNSNNDLNNLKISLIQISNLFSRICHIPSEAEILNYKEKLGAIELHFNKYKLWLGDANKTIEDVLALLKVFIEKLRKEKTEKFIRLNNLVKESNYDYIICPTENEVKSLRIFLNISSYTHVPKVISVADVNDSILSHKPLKGILSGWPKSNNINRILSSFLFSELTVLLYQFESKYYESLLSRNRRYNEIIKSTINKNGIRAENKKGGFDDLYSKTENLEVVSEEIDIVEFELNLEGSQFSKYLTKGNLVESCKARRIDFENNTFIYANDSHKFIVINELIEAKKLSNIHSKKIDALHSGDIIAFINTDRDILAELVEKSTKPNEFTSVKKWTDLWKVLLRDYYTSIDSNFKKLVEDLRKCNCERHEVTIKTWLQDDNKIGPDADDDLISIALLTNSELLNENISTVRKAIGQMTSWRMKASDSVREKIKNKLLEIADPSIINTSVEIQDLGTIEILKISELKKEIQEVDKRYIHRLIHRETI